VAVQPSFTDAVSAAIYSSSVMILRAALVISRGCSRYCRIRIALIPDVTVPMLDFSLRDRDCSDTGEEGGGRESKDEAQLQSLIQFSDLIFLTVTDRRHFSA
jgi:hypothetical protein